MHYRGFLITLIGLLLLLGSAETTAVSLAQGTEFPSLIVSAAWNTTGDTLLVTGRAGTAQYQWGVWLYDDNGQLIRMFPTEDRVSAEWSPDGRHFSMGRNIINAETFEVEIAIDAESGIGFWSLDGTQVLAWTDDRSLGLFDAQTGELERSVAVGETIPDGVSWSPNGEYFALLQPTGYTDIISATDGHLIIRAAPLEDSRGIRYPIGLRWSPDSQYLAAGFTENVEPGTPGTLPNAASPRVASVIIWEVLTGTVIHKFSGLQAAPGPLRWNPRRPEELAGATPDGLVYIWNIESGQEVATLNTLSTLTSMEYSPSGGRLIVGSWADQLSQETTQGYEKAWSQPVIADVLEAFVPISSVERLQLIAEGCRLPTTIESLLPTSENIEQLSDFAERLKSLSEDTVSPTCRADLIAIAESLESSN